MQLILNALALKDKGISMHIVRTENDYIEVNLCMEKAIRGFSVISHEAIDFCVNANIAEVDIEHIAAKVYSAFENEYLKSIVFP